MTWPVVPNLVFCPQSWGFVGFYSDDLGFSEFNCVAVI